MTGFDWQNRCSRWVAFDFDCLDQSRQGRRHHRRQPGKGQTGGDAIVRFVEVRQSTGGGGLHLYVYLDAIPCENHTVHAALARCILGMMSSECNFDFASQIDCCGGVMWVWHRKLTAENGGLTKIKAATRVLAAADLPANWRDHLKSSRGSGARSASTK